MSAPDVQYRGYERDRKCHWLYCTCVHYTRKMHGEDKECKSAIRRLAAATAARFPLGIRYTARGVVSLERLEEAENGARLYTCTKPWSDGTTGITLSPLELVEKFAALVPLPRVHPVRYGGCLAPHSSAPHAVQWQYPAKYPGPKSGSPSDTEHVARERSREAAGLGPQQRVTALSRERASRFSPRDRTVSVQCS